MNKYEKVQKELKSNQSCWLVTGVAGFIGSNLLEKLLLLNQKVRGIDNFDTGHQHNIDQALKEASKLAGHDLSHNFIFINGDIRVFSDCQLACNGVDYILHQAALGSVPRSIDDPINTNKANIDGFLNMIVAAKNAEVKRFVYAASSSTYGDHPELPKVEDVIGNPLSPYAVTKVVNELYASVFAKTYDFRSIGLRYFNVFGKRQDPNGTYSAVIPKWTAAILNEQKVIINGDGETSRDFCFIDNIVQMNILAATVTNKEATDQIYNAACNERTSLNDLYEMIEERLIHGKKGLTKRNPLYTSFRKGDVKHSRADISKAQTLLDYKPEYLVSEGLDKTIKWYIRET